MKKEIKYRKAWIQGNVISFKKPEYKSAVFDLEEVIVVPIKTTPNINIDKIIKLLNNK